MIVKDISYLSSFLANNNKKNNGEVDYCCQLRHIFFLLFPLLLYLILCIFFQPYPSTPRPHGEGEAAIGGAGVGLSVPLRGAEVGILFAGAGLPFL